MRSSLIGTLALAFVTFITVLAAIFQEPLRRYFTRAKLSMEIRLVPPDTVHIDGTNPWTQQFVHKLLYVRIRVTHLRGKPAENAEILLSMLWRDGLGDWVRVRNFLPLSLAWSNTQPPTASRQSG